MEGDIFIKNGYIVQNVLEKMSEGNYNTWLVGALVMAGWSKLKCTTCVGKITLIKSRIRFSSKLNLKFQYLAVPKNIRPNSAQYFIMKIPNKRELQQITYNYSSDVDFKCTTKPYFFLIIDATLASDNLSRFGKHLLERI